jgi:tetraacyldisaccharide 4'-kinase
VRGPRFWSNPPTRPGWQSLLLRPASLAWRVGALARGWTARARPAGVPVVCVGNLTVGGAGKTPMVAALMQRLSAQGVVVHVVSRGFGGVTRGPHRVDPARHEARDVGDEPLMLAPLGTVWVSRDRVAGVRAAAAEGARIVLLDDGFQNPYVAKDRSIVMVDAADGFGNGRLVPAGPLREPVARGLARADLVVLVGGAQARVAAVARWPELERAPLMGAQLRPQPTGLPLEGESVVAFAGIARPEKFFETLRGMGARILAAHSFPDHHTYRPRVMRRLLNDARASGAMLVTTEKDAVRLPSAMRREVVTVQVRLEPEDWAPIDALIAPLLANDRDAERQRSAPGASG